MIYILMHGVDMYGTVYYTDKDKIEKKVEELNEVIKHTGTKFWYKQLQKAE